MRGVTDGTSTLLSPRGAAGAVRAVRGFSLQCRAGPDAGRSFGPFTGSGVSVGSAPTNDVVLTDATVSRYHLSIHRDPQGLRLRDRGSRNGTFLGGHRVLDAFSTGGAVLRLGDTELEVRVADEPTLLEAAEAAGSFGGLVGDSAAMRELYSVLSRLAAADVPVVVHGETGSGKELVARALHDEGKRAGGPFEVVDCGAVSGALVLSELFGHQRGAFTGAEAPRAGAFERADGGTLFLDEIGELPLDLQPKLLRVLEAKTVRRLGAEEARAVDVRVVAATHRDLKRMVNDGGFREDLYFRLAAFEVRVPPLEERLEDLEALALGFLERALSATDRPEAPARLEPETLAALKARDWPGNVRELRNLVERAVVLGSLDEVARGDLSAALRHRAPPALRGGAETTETLEDAKRAFERAYLVRVVARHRGDLERAAAEAGVHRKSLERLLRRHGLRRGELVDGG